MSASVEGRKGETLAVDDHTGTRSALSEAIARGSVKARPGCRNSL
jgi:hypothetical protein